MKQQHRERIDEIVLRLGMVNEDQIKQALLRQKARGGRLGSHLLYYRFLTEAQLVQVLAEHFGIPGIELRGQRIPEDVIQKLPIRVVREYCILPVNYDPDGRCLSIAMIDPDNAEAIAVAREASGIANIRPYVAVESILRGMIAVHYYGTRVNHGLDQVIEMPDLFAGERTFDDNTIAALTTAAASDVYSEEAHNILMVTEASFLRHFLVSIFEREGKNLLVLSHPEQIAEALRENTFDQILVSHGMEASFSQWLREGILKIARPAQIAVYSTVSDCMLDNPIPYSRMLESLLRSLRHVRAVLSSPGAWSPPLELMSKELEALGRFVGLSRIAVDGVKIAAHVLIPLEDRTPDRVPVPVHLGPDSFGAFDKSLQIASSLVFPWDVEGCLRIFFNLIIGRVSVLHLEGETQELASGAQMLALLWYRHYGLREWQATEEKGLGVLKSKLRQQSGGLCTASLIEAYLHVIEQRGKAGITGAQNDVFIISDHNEVSEQLASHLKHAGYRVVEIQELSEARHLCDRQSPDVIVLNYECYAGHALEFASFIKETSRTLLYAFTTTATPSLTLHLLNCGFNDVLAPPFNYDIFVARMSRTISILEKLESEATTRQGFSGTFEELPFLDLIQALHLNQKSVHVMVERQETDERADIYLNQGQMTHAICGGRAGVEAVYEVIRWREQGSFQLNPASDFPPENISSPTEFVLLEGCRLLDEQTA